MAQGTIKMKAPSSKAASKRSTVLGPKKGARTIAPRRQVLVKNAKLTKKFSAGLTAMTERTLGAKAGHLELLKGGKKKDPLDETKGKKSKTGAAGKKEGTGLNGAGGTKKFG